MLSKLRKAFRSRKVKSQRNSPIKRNDPTRKTMNARVDCRKSIPTNSFNNKFNPNSTPIAAWEKSNGYLRTSIRHEGSSTNVEDNAHNDSVNQSFVQATLDLSLTVHDNAAFPQATPVRTKPGQASILFHGDREDHTVSMLDIALSREHLDSSFSPAQRPFTALYDNEEMNSYLEEDPIERPMTPPPATPKTPADSYFDMSSRFSFCDNVGCSENVTPTTMPFPVLTGIKNKTISHLNFTSPDANLADDGWTKYCSCDEVSKQTCDCDVLKVAKSRFLTRVNQLSNEEKKELDHVRLIDRMVRNDYTTTLMTFPETMNLSHQNELFLRMYDPNLMFNPQLLHDRQPYLVEQLYVATSNDRFGGVQEQTNGFQQFFGHNSTREEYHCVPHEHQFIVYQRSSSPLSDEYVDVTGSTTPSESNMLQQSYGDEILRGISRPSSTESQNSSGFQPTVLLNHPVDLQPSASSVLSAEHAE